MKTSYSRSQAPQIVGAHIAIIQSKWYREYTDKMVGPCKKLLEEAGAARVEVHVLPGSLELPLAAQTLARGSDKPDAIIAFGAIIKGDTYHFEMVMNECSQGLARVSLECDIPVISEVLPCTQVDQLIKRSSDDDFNKGIEAAVAAAEMIVWRRTQVSR